MKRLARNLVAVTWFPSIALASSFEVSDIRLEGLQRLSAGTVFASLPIDIGDSIDQSTLQVAARSLFSTGYYDDVWFEEDNGVLVVHVKERPAIDSLELDGNKAIEDDALLSGLSDAGLSEGQIFKRSVLDGIVSELERQYVAQGRYNASVKTEVVELPRNRISIKIVIDEGSAASVRHINIVGNTLFTQEELTENFEMKTSNWLSWMSSDDKYSREKLSGDIETLRSYYLDRGYLDFNIDSSQVSISDDNESIFITLNITEGEQYQIGSTSIVGEMVVPEDELNRLVLLQEGMTFSQFMMTTSSDYMTQRLNNSGYTFAEVNAIPEVNEEGTVDITFYVKPGQRTYVRRVEFRGNTKTADEVLRREMRQMEGATASNIGVDQGKIRLERLGYFSNVTSDTVAVPGTDDQVDVTYAVEEQPSGSIGGSIGYSAGYGMILQGNLQQSNFLGTGNSFGLSISNSKYYTTANISYTDPYFTPDGVSRGFNLFYSVRDFGLGRFEPFKMNRYGGGVTFGWPISEIERISLGLTYSHTEISPGAYPSQQISATPIDPRLEDFGDSNVGWINQDDYENNNGQMVDDTSNPILDDDGNPVLDSEGNPTYAQMYQDDPNDCWDRGTISDDNGNTREFNYFSCGMSDLAALNESQLTNNPPGFLDEFGDSYDDYTLRVSWMQSTLNRGVLPTNGYNQNVTAEITAPGSDLTYWKVDYSAKYFQPLTDYLTLKLSARIGYGDGYGDLDELPFFENFYAGGLGSVRGYERNVLGPRSAPAQRYETTTLIDADGNARYAYIDNGGQLVTSPYNDYSNAFGGNLLVSGSVELIFPTPFVKDQRSVQTSFFVDFGNVYSTSCENGETNCSTFDASLLNQSYGLSLTWISGFGPLTFSYAMPFNYDEDLDGGRGRDYTERFQFSMGQSF